MSHWRVRIQAGLGLLVAAVASATASVQDVPAGEVCGAQVTAQLQTWGATAPARPQPPPSGAARLRHWPTPHLGVWLAEWRGASGAGVVRVAPDTVSRIEWSSACVAATSERPRPSAAAPRFSDADLTALLARPGRGVLYLWSPHMPLSVDAYRAITDAAAARGLAVHVILDPGADRAFAAAEQARGALPVAALRVVDSVELQFRDVLVHAPTVQVFIAGTLVGSPLPGAHTSDEYGQYLDRVVAAAPRED